MIYEDAFQNHIIQWSLWFLVSKNPTSDCILKQHVDLGNDSFYILASCYVHHEYYFNNYKLHLYQVPTFSLQQKQTTNNNNNNNNFFKKKNEKISGKFRLTYLSSVSSFRQKRINSELIILEVSWSEQHYTKVKLFPRKNESINVSPTNNLQCLNFDR